MVLVGERRAEERKDAVAGALHHITAVAAYGFDHQLERRIDDRARLFGVEVLFELGRTLDVGEERGDGLALAVERRRGIGTLGRDANRWPSLIGGGRPGRLRRSRSGERRSALAAESRLGRVFGAALRAARSQAGATADAELLARGIVEVAARAAHWRWLD